MQTSHASAGQPPLSRGNVLKAIGLGLVGAVICGIMVVIGYQAEKQTS